MTVPSIAISSGTEYRLYRSAVLGAFAAMPMGRLRVVLPDGSDQLFGRDESHPPAMIRVQDPIFFKKCVLFGDIGFGESYVDGDWDSDSVFDVVSWFLLNLDRCPTVSGSSRQNWRFNVLSLINRLVHAFRLNNLSGSRRNIRSHYDLGNNFFRIFLDPGMTYSSACFDRPDISLEDAQTAKYERFCRKLRIGRDSRVLEIGSGWGGFCVHAAKTRGCRVTGVTISRDQYEFARRRVFEEGLADRVDVRLQDYRQVTGEFDRILSIEMLEAVGDEYLDAFFAKCHALLTPDGLLGLQVITCPDSRYESLRANVDWIQKHIFPGSLLPSVRRIVEGLRRTGDLQLHELEDIGSSYVRTLSEWRCAYISRLDEVRSLGCDERFIRKWDYYLEYCRAAFRMRNITVIQAVFSRPNNRVLTTDS